MDEVFIARPSGVLRRAIRVDGAGFEAGMLAMALEVLTTIKVIESLPLQGSIEARQETVSTLTQLLVDLELWDAANDWYLRLWEQRRLKFVADDVLGDDAPASGLGGLPGDEPPLRSTHAQPESGQSQDLSSRVWDLLTTREGLAKLSESDESLAEYLGVDETES